MAFEIVKTFVVRPSPERVWAFLTDPEQVAKCLPGAAITGKLDEKTWQGTINVKVGPALLQLQGQGLLREARRGRAHGGDRRLGPGRARQGRRGFAPEQRPAREGARRHRSHHHLAGEHHRHPRADGPRHGAGRRASMFQIFSQRMRAELESATPAAASAPPAPSAPSASPPRRSRSLPRRRFRCRSLRPLRRSNRRRSTWAPSARRRRCGRLRSGWLSP